jgi:hypothetical protein
LNQSEKGFLDLWLNAFSKIPKNRINTFFGFSGIILGVFPHVFGPIPNFGKDWSDFAALMVQVFASLLGFIIAGYTIFSTSANPEFIVAFWRHVDKKSEVPLFKLHLIVYMRLFLCIFTGTIFFGGIVLSYKIWILLRADLTFSSRGLVLIQTIIAAATGWQLTSAAVQVKAMIFNLYDLTITQASYLEIADRQKKMPKDSN